MNSQKKIISGAEPFFFKRGKKTGCLMVHGFTSTPYDNRALGEYLAKQGVTASGILVAGHGTKEEDLIKTDYSDWLSSVEEGIRKLQKEVEKIFLVGISFGGNMLLYLAQKFNFSGIVLVGTPIFFRLEKIYRTLIPVVRLFKKYQKKRYLRTKLDPAIIRERPNYQKIPLKSLDDVAKVIELSRKCLTKVFAPSLIMQSNRDHAVQAKTVTYLFEKIASKDKKIVWLNDFYHVPLIDHRKEEVFKIISDFIREKS